MTIGWFVGSIIVDAIDRKPLRPFAHVRKKALEGKTPTIANGDAALTIIAIAGIVRIGATLNDIQPCAIKWMTIFATRFAVFSVAFEKVLAMQAPARGGCSRFEVGSNYGAVFPATTLTKPSSFSVFAIGKTLDHGQSTERLAGDINGFGHRDLRAGGCVKWRVGAPTLTRCAF